MRTSQVRATLTSYTPLMMVWALLCLVITASFQSEPISQRIELTKQSPLAQFNHVGSHYSLRFNGAQLDDEGDDLDGLIEVSDTSAINRHPAPISNHTQIVQRVRAFLPLPRAPPRLLK